MEPWGTPAEIYFHSDCAPGSKTLCLRFDKYDENQERREPDMPNDLSLNNRPLCQTRSKALLMSQKTTRTSLPESTDCENKLTR